MNKRKIYAITFVVTLVIGLALLITGMIGLNYEEIFQDYGTMNILKGGGGGNPNPSNPFLEDYYGPFLWTGGVLLGISFISLILMLVTKKNPSNTQYREVEYEDLDIDGDDEENIPVQINTTPYQSNHNKEMSFDTSSLEKTMRSDEEDDLVIYIDSKEDLIHVNDNVINSVTMLKNESNRTNQQLPQMLLDSFSEQDDIYDKFIDTSKNLKVWMGSSNENIILVFFILEGTLITWESNIEVALKTNTKIVKTLVSSEFHDPKLAIVKFNKREITNSHNIKKMTLNVFYKNSSNKKVKISSNDITFMEKLK